jgi:hypothetical protein
MPLLGCTGRCAARRSVHDPRMTKYAIARKEDTGDNIGHLSLMIAGKRHSLAIDAVPAHNGRAPSPQGECDSLHVRTQLAAAVLGLSRRPMPLTAAPEGAARCSDSGRRTH